MSGKLRLTGDVEITAKKMLKESCEILDRSNIPYILEGGTLLGIIRENRLLPWDNDVDLTITEEHFKKLKRSFWKFRLKGYGVKIKKSLKDIPHFPKGTVRIVKIRSRWSIFRGYSLVDIFVKRKVGQQYFWTVGIRKPVLKSAPSHYYENLIQYDFEGCKYSVPERYEDYLTYRYGDWKTPVKEYNYRKDDKAIVKKESEVKE